MVFDGATAGAVEKVFARNEYNVKQVTAKMACRWHRVPVRKNELACFPLSLSFQLNLSISGLRKYRVRSE
jgi:hypothetical protein